MAEKTRLQEKLDLFKAGIKFEKTDHVPNISNFYTWKFLNKPETLSQILSDPELIEKYVFEFHEKNQFDAYIDLGTRNLMGVMNALGEDCFYKVDDASGEINFREKVLMNADEYDDYISNKSKLIWKMFKRKFPELTKGRALQAVSESLKFRQFATNIINKFVDTYDTPALFNMFTVPIVPYENIVGYYRGMRDGALDLRKNKEKLKEALDMDFYKETLPRLMQNLDTPNTTFCYDMYTAMLGHSVMSVKQFGEFYWPYLKRIIDECISKNKTLYIYCESTVLRLAEYFQDIPKGHVVLHVEQDDPREVRKAIPNICLAGGMRTTLLGTGTPEECVDYARSLIDDMGTGYLFSQDHMVSYPNDCREDNLTAVNEFIRSYKL